MGYDMYCRGARFRIDASNTHEALKALVKWDNHQPSYYQWELAKEKTLEDALGTLGWGCEVNTRGDITDINFEGGRFREEGEWMKAIAPFVRSGSYIEMCGEDDSFWCWYFDGKTCTSYQGEVVFPGMPPVSEVCNDPI